MPIPNIPRFAFRTALRGARLPLTALEAVAQRDRDPAHPWAPALLFETVEAGAKSVAGAVLRDPELTDEARIQRARLEQLRQAELLEVDAAQDRAAAKAELAQTRDELARRNREIDAKAADREHKVEQEKAEAERRIAAEARKREQQANELDQARQKAVAKADRAARATKVAGQTSALAAEKRAVETAGTAIAVENALERKKAQRKSG